MCVVVYQLLSGQHNPSIFLLVSQDARWLGIDEHTEGEDAPPSFLCDGSGNEGVNKFVVVGSRKRRLWQVLSTKAQCEVMSSRNAVQRSSL